MSEPVSLLVNIDVDDLPRAERFYTRVFGLTVHRRFGDDGVELTGAATPLFLLRKPAGSVATAAGQQRDYQRHWTPVHLDFVVADVDATVALALAEGAALERPAHSASWAGLPGWPTHSATACAYSAS